MATPKELGALGRDGWDTTISIFGSSRGIVWQLCSKKPDSTWYQLTAITMGSNCPTLLEARRKRLSIVYHRLFASTSMEPWLPSAFRRNELTHPVARCLQESIESASRLCPYSETSDGQHVNASTCRGENLVIIARRVLSYGTPRILIN
jgi:hypothetical protein